MKNKKETLEERVKRIHKQVLKEDNQKYVKWFETSKGKATGMIQISIGQDSTGEKTINLTSQNAGIHANEIDEIINTLKQYKTLLTK